MSKVLTLKGLQKLVSNIKTLINNKISVIQSTLNTKANINHNHFKQTQMLLDGYVETSGGGNIYSGYVDLSSFSSIFIYCIYGECMVATKYLPVDIFIQYDNVAPGTIIELHPDQADVKIWYSNNRICVHVSDPYVVIRVSGIPK